MNTQFAIFLVLLVAVCYSQNTTLTPEEKHQLDRDQIKRQKFEAQIRGLNFYNENSTLTIQNSTFKYDALLICQNFKTIKGKVLISYKCADPKLNDTQNQWVEWNYTTSKGKYLIRNNTCEEVYEFSANNETLKGITTIKYSEAERIVNCQVSANYSGKIQQVNYSLKQLLTGDHASEELVTEEQSTDLSGQTGNTLTSITSVKDQTTMTLKTDKTRSEIQSTELKSKTSTTIESNNGTEVSNSTSTSSKNKQSREWITHSGVSSSGFSFVSEKSKQTVGYKNGSIYVDSLEGKQSQKTVEKFFKDNLAQWEFTGQMSQLINQSLQTTKNLNFTENWNLNGVLNFTETPALIPNLDKTVQKEKEPQVPSEQQPKDIKEPKQPKQKTPEVEAIEAEQANQKLEQERAKQEKKRLAMEEKKEQAEKWKAPKVDL